MTIFRIHIKKLTQALYIISALSLTACNQPSQESTTQITEPTSTEVSEQEAIGTEHVIWMMDENDNGDTMVFEPAYIKVDVGDTLVFKNKSGSHSIASRLVPNDAKPFAGEGADPIKVTVEKEGVYLYVCPPHEAMNMVGVIQVGEAINIDAVKKSLPELEATTVMNQGRWENYAELID